LLTSLSGILIIYTALHRNKTPITFKPSVYFSTVLQVGGIGSDIVSKKAYYIGDGSGINQEGWPNYLGDDYALVSFNTPFYMMYLNCKEGYRATILADGTPDKKPFSSSEDRNGNSIGFGILIKDTIKNTIAIKCEILQ
jgi:hypothetical protein